MTGKAVAFTKNRKNKMITVSESETSKHKFINEIRYPDKISEFEVQAELYQRLRNCGLVVRGEVIAAYDDFGRRRRSRMDLVVFDDAHNPLVIVECKNHSYDSTLSRFQRTKQHRHYSSFGLPVVLCSNMNCVGRAKSEVLNLI